MVPYNSSIATYKLCSSNTIRNYTLERIAYFNQSIANYENQTDQLSSKGIDTSALAQLLQNAKTEIISPFATAIARQQLLYNWKPRQMNIASLTAAIMARTSIW